ncbi:MAG: nitroreductase family protein [Syntrophorhabdaceae bacterium]
MHELIIKSRSYRRFYQDVPVNSDQLKDLVEMARLSPSQKNLQPLKYIISHNPNRNSGIFSCLAWAGYLKDWPGPEEGQRPGAYIIILGDTTIAPDFGFDHGIAAQTILLGATETGLGGCIIANINRDRLSTLLRIPQKYQILLVIALGKPREEVVMGEIRDGNIRYWRDENQVHHVPKRPLSELILKI